MAHPFEKLFYKALKKSTDLHNEVVVVAAGLVEKGYDPKEVATVLAGLARGLIDKNDNELAQEAYDYIAASLDE